MILCSLIFTTTVQADECLEDVLSYITGLKHNSRFLENKRNPTRSRTKEMLNHAAYHNDIIPIQFSTLSNTTRTKAVNETIEHYARYDRSFDQPAFIKWMEQNSSKDEYLKWLKENPEKLSAKQLAEKDTIGAFLNRQYIEFEKKNPPVNLQAISENVAGDMRKIAKECGGKLDCAKVKIADWMKKTLGKSCIAGSPASQRDLASMMLLTNSTYFITYATDKSDDKEFPFDLMVTNLFWQPFLAEAGCKASQSGQKIGQKINFGQQSAYANYGKNYATYMKLSPAYNATVMGVITAKDLIKGNEIDWAKRGAQFLALNFYDAAYANQRILLVQNPLYLKKFQNLKEGIDRAAFKNIPNKALGSALANTTYYSLDWGSRIAIGMANTRIYQSYMKMIDEQVTQQRDQKTGPNPETTASPSASPH